MDKLDNIFIPHAGKSANSPQAQSSGLSKEDLLSFLRALVQSAGKPGQGGDLAAKLSQLLKDNKIDHAEALKLLQQLPPGQNDALIKKLSGLLKAAPEVKPALTSDLTAGLSAQLQEDTMPAADPGEVLQQLRDDFAQIKDMSPEALSQFRQDAIHMMEGLGFGPADIESMLVQLAMDLQGQMNDEQMTLLMMPFRPDAPAAVAAKAQSASAAPAPITPQQLAEQQLDAAAQNPQGEKPARAAPATAPDKANAPAPQQQAPQQQAQPQPQPDTQAAKPAPHTPSNLALLNSFAGDNSGFSGGGFSGQSFQQGGYAPSGGLQMTSGETAGNFINHMGAASTTGGMTTQMIALQIHRNAQAQVDTFRMQLQPAELGRLEVRLKFGRDGTLKAHLIAEKQDTLSLLQKDQVQLQKILQDAGVDIDGGGLSFDLRQQQHNKDTSQSYNDRGAGTGLDDEDAMPPAALQAKIAVETMGSIRPGGVNITV